MRSGFAAGSVAVLGALLLSSPLAAQWNVEVRGGASVGSHSGTAAGLDVAPRLSYEALVERVVKPGIGVYGGFAHTRFGCEEGFCLDRNLTVSGKHATAGVELAYSRLWVRAGLLFGVTEIGSEGEASDPGVGVQGALGLTLGSGRVSFLPGMSYRRFSADMPGSSGHATALTADVGVRMRLGSE
jgi:hypothetical protein